MSDKLNGDDTQLNTTFNVSDEPVLQPPPLRKISAQCAKIGGLYHAETCDVNFIFDVNNDEVVVPAHKCILAFHSPVFRQMFYGELKEKEDIKLTDTTMEAFIDFMKCIYVYAVNFIIQGTPMKITNLLHLAHKYHVNWLEKRCKHMLHEIIDENFVSVLWVLPLANLYSYDELRQKCIELIDFNGESIIDSPEFIHCDKKAMKEILGIAFVNRHEVNVFKICIQWAKSACKKAKLDPESPKNIREQLGDCFELIRFKWMAQEQFLQCLSINSALFSLYEIQEFASKLCVAKPTKYKENPIRATVKPTFEIETPFNTIESSLELLLEDQTTADVHFVLKNDKNEEIGRIGAHKCILASKSEVLANRFKDKTQSKDEIIIAGVSPEAFVCFLRMMYAHYRCQFFAILKKVDERHIDAVLTLNEKYRKEYYLFYKDMYTFHFIISLNKKNVFRRFEVAQKYSLDEVKAKCIDLMKENGEQLISSHAFMDCSQQNLKAILELRIWDDCSQPLVNACIKWAKTYCSENKLDAAISYNLRTALGDALALIPFSKMDPREFINFQRNYKGLLTADEIVKIIDEL